MGTAQKGSMLSYSNGFIEDVRFAKFLRGGMFVEDESWWGEDAVAVTTALLQRQRTGVAMATRLIRHRRPGTTLSRAEMKEQR